jgi:RNA polymerase sigma-70 factor, ECF subfamily
MVVAVADRVLLDAARAGDADAFEVLVRRHEGRVYRVAFRLLGSDADAQDAAQETFVRAWRGLGGFAARALSRRGFIGS